MEWLIIALGVSIVLCVTAVCLCGTTDWKVEDVRRPPDT